MVIKTPERRGLAAAATNLEHPGERASTMTLKEMTWL